MGAFNVLYPVDLHKNQAKNIVIDVIDGYPTDATLGQVCTVGSKLAYFNGTEWVQLETTPSVFGTVNVNGSSDSSANLTGRTAVISADSSADAVKIKAGNKWIAVDASTTDKSVSFGHRHSGVESGQYGQETAGDSSVITIPYITIDAAGHITDAESVTVNIKEVTPAAHAHGNITSTGKLADASCAVVTKSDKTVIAVSMETSDPSTDGSSLEFIDSVSQNKWGKITATKKAVPDATEYAKGVVKLGAEGGAAKFDHSHTNMVTGSDLADGMIVYGAGGSAVRAGGVSVTSSIPGSDSTDSSVPTSKAVYTAILNGISTVDAMTYKGAIEGGAAPGPGTFTPDASKGFTYKVSAAGYIDGVQFEAGDMLICNTDTSAANAGNYQIVIGNWDQIQTNLTVGSKAGNVQSNGDDLIGNMAVCTDDDARIVTVNLANNDEPVTGRYVSSVKQEADGKITVNRADLPQASQYTFGHASQHTESGLTVSYQVKKNADASVTYYNDVTGVLNTAHGGTGASSFTEGSLLTGHGTDAVSADYSVIKQGDSSVSVISSASTDGEIPTAKAVYNVIEKTASKDFCGTVTPVSGKSVSIAHNLGSKNVIVAVFETSTGDNVLCDIARIDTNTLRLLFGETGNIGDLTVCVHRCD